MPQRNALLVNIKPEDEMAAVRQNKWNCAIVRAIQRQLPDAIRVHADAKTIEWTMPEDHLRGQEGRGVRYVSQTTQEIRDNVIRNFDTDHVIPEEWKSFTIAVNEAVPVIHKPREKKVLRNDYQRRSRATRKRTKSANVASYNRFRDYDDGGDAA